MGASPVLRIEDGKKSGVNVYSEVSIQRCIERENRQWSFKHNPEPRSQASGTTVWQGRVLQTGQRSPAKEEEELQVGDSGEFRGGDGAGQKQWALFTDLNATDLHH